MVSMGPNSQSFNYTHMFDIPDLRGPLPVENNNKILVNVKEGVYVCKDSITGIIYTHPDFTTFKYILGLSGLQGIYGDPQANFTIFVPSDMFIKKTVPESVLVNLDRATARELVRSVTLRRRIPSSILSDSPVAYFKNVYGRNVLVENINDRIMVSEKINVIHKDWICGNGIIHVTDALNMI